MGKRSTTSTKSGKYMNPTDQARKEARRRELKKNKKQRQMVRTAVLKGKNPRQIIAELEKLDDVEFNPLAAPPLNDKVLKDKRRKLHETWQRLIRVYEKENIDQFLELKKLWHNYQNRKQDVMEHFEKMKDSQPEQDDQEASTSAEGHEAQLQTPFPKPGILKKPSVLDALKPKICPGVPACPPPLLSDYELKEEDEAEAKKSRTIRFNDEGNDESDLVAPGEESGPQVDEIQRKMLRMSGQDVDLYMKEMEEVHRQTQEDKAEEVRTRLARIEDPQQANGPPPGAPPGMPPSHLMPPGHRPPHPMGMPPPPPAGMPPMMGGRPPMMYRPAPPPLRPGMAPPSVRLPPGPPPGRPSMPPGPPPGRPPMMPPGPPPGVPPTSARPRQPASSATGGGVLSAGPQLNKDSPATKPSGMSSTSTVIEAKPQMRNLRNDVTRFVPVNVKVKRDTGKRKQSDPLKDVFKHPQQQSTPQPSKDDAYAEFMKEMDQLLH